MSLIDKQICDAILDKVSECYTSLSEDVRKFMTTEVDKDDILDMLHATLYYKQVIRDRFYMEDTDEHNFEILTIMETLLKLFIDHMDDI